MRIPPLSEADGANPVIGAATLALIERSIIFENDSVLILNKPSGVAVHGGSGLRFGAIDIIRCLRPGDPGIELAHRLDRDTSGCLVFAKNYPTLRLVQKQLSSRDSRKTYLALLRGELSQTRVKVDLGLAADRAGGEKRTVVDRDGKYALSEFALVEILGGMSVATVTIATGRTHQIRVHAAAIGHPVAGDAKYGDRAANADMRRLGLRRMFLHAASVILSPGSGMRAIAIDAPLPEDLRQFLSSLRCRAPD